MTLENRISNIRDIVRDACNSWVKPVGSERLEFVDPNDGEEISAHYGASHFAVSLIINGRMNSDLDSYDKGVLLLRSVLDGWENNTLLKDFHFDFNNFALCLAEEYLKTDENDIRSNIRKIVIQTIDSKHYTVNWLPMRMYVNQKRGLWSGSEKFNKNVLYCKELIKSATNSDGGIEDCLPKGRSFNLQYNVATVALLQFINCRGGEFDISRELGFLLDKVLPDGDINYHGRGANQIFGWGLWIYLLSSSGRLDELTQALDFLTEKIEITVRNQNLMLNDWHGEEKYLWWDYHYCSVYNAHLVFWLSLALQDYCKKPVKPIYPKKSSTGVLVTSNRNYFSVSFEGRSDYLAEKGPMLSALWVKGYGTVFKSTMGPWLGLFGNRYLEESVLRNYIGLLSVKPNFSFQNNRVFRRLSRFFVDRQSIKFTPLFNNFRTSIDKDKIVFTYINSGNQKAMFNLPVIQGPGECPEFSLILDGRPSKLRLDIKYRNQYGWCNLYKSEVSTAREWVLVVK
ncbi:hypothetical protein [Thalassotalea sp. ND16A]|uniref:hypothetical protein n=1 Tax=Thalassotalea sp. ND16A TaxID=1535422 RepID=UPI00051A3F8B|nr:hypothetical protein [Thalassotalea sp. ND16A]KGJ94228.1 hypothetical protein ND16A_1434 [Thalassotalea sp. ND16A]